jgi:micrococcal nuclease
MLHWIMDSVSLGKLGRLKLATSGLQFRPSKHLALLIAIGVGVLGLVATVIAPNILREPAVAGASTEFKFTASELREFKSVKLLRVIDGDTIEVREGGQKKTLRLIGIDTPELARAGKPADCFADEATQKLTGLSYGQELLIRNDPTQDNQDRYGRYLRYLATSDGKFLNYEMIAQGYAFEYTYQVPYEYQQQFKQAQTSARENSRGLYGAGCEVPN